MTLDGSGHLSQFVQLDVAQFMDDATGFLAGDYMEFSGFPRSYRIDFVREPFLVFSTNSWIFAHSLFIFQDYFLCNSFNSEVDKLFLNCWLSSTLQFPGTEKLRVICWVTLLLTLPSLHQFPGAGRRTLRGVLLLLL